MIIGRQGRIRFLGEAGQSVHCAEFATVLDDILAGLRPRRRWADLLHRPRVTATGESLWALASPFRRTEESAGRAVSQ